MSARFGSVRYGTVRFSVRLKEGVLMREEERLSAAEENLGMERTLFLTLCSEDV